MSGLGELVHQPVAETAVDLSAILDMGLLADASAHGFGMLMAKLDLSKLGIVIPDSSFALHPAMQGSLPERHRRPCRRPADKLREVLYRYSFNFSITRTLLASSYRWVPMHALPQVTAEVEACHDELSTAIAGVEHDWSNIVQESAALHADLGRQALVLLRDRNAKLPLNERVVLPSEGEFIAQVVAAGQKQVPTADMLRQGLILNMDYSSIRLGSDWYKEAMAAREAKHELELQSVAQRASWHAAKLAAAATVEAAKQEASLQDEVRRMQYEASIAHLHAVVDPVREAFQQTVDSLATETANVLAAMEKREVLTGHTLKGIKSTAQRFSLMTAFLRHANVPRYAELADMVQQLASMANPGMQNSTNNNMRDLLNNMRGLCLTESAKLHAELGN